MTDEQRVRIERFLVSEFGSEAAAKVTEEGKQEWHDYFTALNAELIRRAAKQEL